MVSMTTTLRRVAPAMGDEFVRDLKEAWRCSPASGPPRFCQRQIGYACVLAHASQRWDLARNASELEVGETRQRPRKEEGRDPGFGGQVLPAATVS